MNFLKDMDALNIDKPDIITHVTNYIPEIIEFITELVENQKAYVSYGSVYFDLKKYMDEGNQFYFHKFQERNPKESKDIKSEGKKEKKITKKFWGDFALWKGIDNTTDIGWDSPFGYGRPGWHIECSTMSINVLKEINEGIGTMTMHSGGIDLAYPHHENEIIQSESYLNDKPWVKVFSHIGHLNIQGQKMSKSLKNFIKIKDFIGEKEKETKGGVVGNNINTLRMMTLMTKYHQPMDFNDGYVEYANSLLKRINDFFTHIQNIGLSSYQKFQYDKEVMDKINELEFKIDQYVNDDFELSKVILAIMEMIELGYSTESNYVKFYIDKIVRKWYNLFGFLENQNSHDNKNNLDLIVKIRNDIRNMAKKNPVLYQLSDKIRDEYLKDFGLQDL